MSNLSIQPRLSSHNAFRAHLLTPNPSEASETSSLPSYHTTLPFSHPSLTRSPTGTSTVSRAPTYRTLPLHPTTRAAPQPPPITLTTDLPPELPPDAIPDGPPPAYSLTPDTEGGETAVAQGPRWPFQRAPDPFVQQSQLNSQSPLGLPDSVPEPPAVPLQQQPRYTPLPGRLPPAASVSQQPRYAHSPRAPPPSSHPPVASTSNGIGSTVPPTRDRYPRRTTPGQSSQSNRPTLVQPETYLCHNCRNTEHFDQSRARIAPVRSPPPPPGDGPGRGGMSKGRTVKPKKKGLRKMFSWITRSQQLSTAHTPQPRAGLEDEDLQFRDAVQASLEEAGSQAFFEQMLREQEAALREHHLDEVTHLENDQAYGSFSEARNAVEDEDEQLRLAIAESVYMALEQGDTQTYNEWADLESTFTGERTQGSEHSDRVYDEDAGYGENVEEYEEYEYENARYDDEDTEGDDHDSIGQSMGNPVTESMARNRAFLERLRREQEAALREHYPDEVTHLEDDQAYGSFPEARNAVEDEDEQLRRAIAESVEMAREQGHAQTNNEWADLESTYTDERTQGWVHGDRAYDEDVGYDDNAEDEDEDAERYEGYEYENPGYDNKDLEDDDHDCIGQTMETLVAESIDRSQTFLEQMLQEQEAALREHHLDEGAHLEDDQTNGSFSDTRNTVEDEDEQLRRAIAESAEMACEQGYTQTDEWADLESAYTGERTQGRAQCYSVYDEDAGYNEDAEDYGEYENENAGYDDDVAEGDVEGYEYEHAGYDNEDVAYDDEYEADWEQY